MTPVHVTLSPNMRALLHGDFLNGETFGYIGAAVMKETFGPGKIEDRHFVEGQGEWPEDGAKYTREKPDKRKFYLTGTAYRALSANPDGSALSKLGGKQYVTSKGFTGKKFKSNGIFCSVRSKPGEMRLVCGFAGELDYSKAFKAIRTELAKKRGVNTHVKGMKWYERRDAINKAVKPDEVRAVAKEKGIARVWAKPNKNNIGYARVVEAGGRYGPKHHNKRPLMPYKAADTTVIEEAVGKALQDIFDVIEGKS